MLIQGKKALIFGVANDRSIAYAIARELKNNGASIALSYGSEVLRKRVEPIHQRLEGDFLFQCDVTDDEAIARSAELVAEKWGDTPPWSWRGPCCGSACPASTSST